MSFGKLVDWMFGKSKKKDDKEKSHGSRGSWFYNIVLIRRCFNSPRTEFDKKSPTGTIAKHGSKLPNDTKQDQPVILARPSSTSSYTPIPSTPSTPNVVEELKISFLLRKFSYSELKIATGNFRPHSYLGEGGFGLVFKAWIIENGASDFKTGSKIPVAVKTLNLDGLQGHKEWLAEVTYLGRLRHPNLVKLIGYCIEDDQRLLVYEFMSRGSLENHIFRRSSPILWSTRMKIALGAAKGLAFLHEEAQKPVIFRDFKTSNILLDSDFNAKLSDFGLAKDAPEGDETHSSTSVMGTYGYAAPEYVMTGHLTSKSDVYSFGVVLLELLTGRRSMDKNQPRGQQNLVKWAQSYFPHRKKFFRMMDPALEGRFSMKGCKRAIELAADCLNQNPKARPRMSEVVRILSPLPYLKDMASSPSHPAQRIPFSPNARSGNRMQPGYQSRNKSATSTPTASPYARRENYRSPIQYRRQS